MTVGASEADLRPGPVEGLLSLLGVSALAWSWVFSPSGRWGDVGAQMIAAAVGWRCARIWRRHRHQTSNQLGSTTDAMSASAEIAPDELLRTVVMVSLPVVVALLVVRHSGDSVSIAVWDGNSSPTESLLGHLWPLAAISMYTAGFTLLQRVIEAVTPHWRAVMSVISASVAAVALGEWLSSSSDSLGGMLWSGSRSWGIASAIALALVVPERSFGVNGWFRPFLPDLSVAPLTTSHARPARWLVGALLWGLPAVLIFTGGIRREGLEWLPLVALVGATLVGGWATSLIGGWSERIAVLPVATRRAISVAAVSTIVLVGTSTAVSAGGVAGGPGLRSDSAGLLRLAVPSLDVVIPRSLDVFLVGDSTMAPMRWFRQGQASLRGFDYVLDVESCRKIAKRSCWGRESRIPTSATLAIESRRRDFDYVVLMAGAHSTRKDIAEEIRMAQLAAEKHGAKLLIVTLRESRRYVQEGIGPGESAFTEFNRIIRTVAEDLGPEKVGLIDWNGFSYRHPEWFRSDGIHPNLTGTVALGWFLSQSIAAEAGNPCPYDWSYPCPAPGPEDGDQQWLSEFGVAPTDEHCYEDGNDRIPICQRDRRM